MTLDEVMEWSLVGLLLQGDSIVGGNDVDVEGFELDAFEDPKAPEKGGLPPLVVRGVDFFGAR